MLYMIRPETSTLPCRDRQIYFHWGDMMEETVIQKEIGVIK